MRPRLPIWFHLLAIGFALCALLLPPTTVVERFGASTEIHYVGGAIVMGLFYLTGIGLNVMLLSGAVPIRSK